MARKLYPKPGETWKAHQRRSTTGWFDKYAPPDKPGIDISPNGDPLNHTFRRWIYEIDGDATSMKGVPDDTFQTTYSSNVLEHLSFQKTALSNWYRITAPGGHLIVLVPDRDRYEKRNALPSRWNKEHKWFFLGDRDDPPYTFHFRALIKEAIPEGQIVSYELLDEGFDYRGDNEHSFGEYCWEAIILKPAA